MDLYGGEYGGGGAASKRDKKAAKRAEKAARKEEQRAASTRALESQLLADMQRSAGGNAWAAPAATRAAVAAGPSAAVAPAGGAPSDLVSLVRTKSQEERAGAIGAAAQCVSAY